MRAWRRKRAGCAPARRALLDSGPRREEDPWEPCGKPVTTGRFDQG